ncbi:MAG: IS1634 family transposase [Anaerolineaceae bacterium]|nr:IS1634 family transposase [Anaerolineaceae bacterium]
MFVEVVQNNGNKYLRLVQSVRVTNKAGYKVSQKKVVFNIGPLSKYDDGEPNYVERLKESYKEGKPLIDSLLPYVGDAPKEQYTIRIESGSKYCTATPKRFAPCILDPVFSSLGLDSLMATIKHSAKIAFDLQGILRLLVYGRLLEPASKAATMKQNASYYRPLVKSTNDSNAYDVLDIIYANRKQIIQRMNSSIKKGIGRNTNTVYYDVTNFFFEIEEPDEDETDEDGVVEKGLRKLGVSKEERKLPIVQMGLFLDDNGIPISIEQFSGNTLDHLTLRTAMKNTVNDLKLDRFILIADRGMYSGTNMCHVVNQGHGYIVSKSLKKSAESERKWVLDQDGYTVVSPDFRYKSRVITRTVTDEDGTKKKVQEKVVVYWSRAFYAREKHENESFLAFIQKLKSNPNGFRITAAQSRSLKKFMKKEMLNKETGEIIDSKKLLSMIDDDKLTEFNDLMGYYQIVTSELDMDDREIIDKYHGLTRIEDQFREMKGTLDTRPIWVNTPEHIHAHLLICFIALTMMRLIQYKIKMSLPPDKTKDLNWSYGLPGDRLQKALLDWQVEEISDEYYRMVNVDSDDLRIILKAYDIDLPLKLFTRADLRSLKSSVYAF